MGNGAKFPRATKKAREIPCRCGTWSRRTSCVTLAGRSGQLVPGGGTHPPGTLRTHGYRGTPTAEADGEPRILQRTNTLKGAF